MKNLSYILFGAFLFRQAFSNGAELSALDQNVFKSLERTELKTLTGNFTNDRIFMDYILHSNIIEKVSAKNGKFDMLPGRMLAELPQTKGTLSGDFKVEIKVNWKKAAVNLRADGKYQAEIDDVTLKIDIQLPTKTSRTMGLNSCLANVSQLNLYLKTENEVKQNGLLKNLNEWLKSAMLPGFSDLFCDTMNKILNNGTNAAVLHALQRRMCILKPENCPKPKAP